MFALSILFYKIETKESKIVATMTSIIQLCNYAIAIEKILKALTNKDLA